MRVILIRRRVRENDFFLRKCVREVNLWFGWLLSLASAGWGVPTIVSTVNDLVNSHLACGFQRSL